MNPPSLHDVLEYCKPANVGQPGALQSPARWPIRALGNPYAISRLWQESSTRNTPCLDGACKSENISARGT